ncbi:MAG TPA: NAD(P)H-dependent glycerol-3-phosphate dehydrogenase [Chthoniobacteraceae bacterium]|nr:NAD(P)H-dependent glycerol-3-phosphate dehydrogenase [Chthoniobacteraceae bacterium]
MNFQNIGVIGAGGWGTALALLLSQNRYPITLWGHNPGETAQFAAQRENTAYLPGVKLPGEFRWTSELEDLAECDLLLFVTPSKALREVSARLSTVMIRKEAVLLSCVKGVERGSGSRMTEIVAEFFPRHAIAALSGPSHAEEVARQQPTAVTIACADADAAQRLQKAFTTSFFRAYTNDDVAGVELGGALKNIFAVAAGVCDGLGLGDNTKAALVTRALAEMVRLGVALGGRRETFMGLSGIGDLMVTCFSQHSRNRRVGERLGKGERLADIVSSMQMVAEGVPTTYSAQECARKLGIETPITDQMRAILDGAVSARDALTALLTREPKAE